jgi:iron(III) transport system ATP-binding protein
MKRHRSRLARSVTSGDREMMQTLRVDDVSMVFDNGFRALHEVSLEAQAGQFVTLLGPSGCGKTTLLKLVAGFLQPTSGSIRMNGAEITHLPPEKRDTAIVFQSYALFPHMTVADNITFGLEQQKLPRDERHKRLEDALVNVSLETQRDKRPAALSGGQQQRVALARALAMRPGLTLYDEPLSNLDAKLREQVRFELRTLQRDHGFTALYVTHDQAEALAMSDVIYLLNEGRVVQAGAPHDIYSRPVNRFVADFLGVANVFQAQVVDGGDRGEYKVESPFGVLKVHSDEAPASAAVHMCWRPEHARLVGPSDDADNTFTLNVTETVFLGNLTDVVGHVDAAPDLPLRVQMLGHKAVSGGDPIRLSLAPSDLRFLESTT